MMTATRANTPGDIPPVTNAHLGSVQLTMKAKVSVVAKDGTRWRAPDTITRPDLAMLWKRTSGVEEVERALASDNRAAAATVVFPKQLASDTHSIKDWCASRPRHPSLSPPTTVFVLVDTCYFELFFSRCLPYRHLSDFLAQHCMAFFNTETTVSTSVVRPVFFLWFSARQE